MPDKGEERWDDGMSEAVKQQRRERALAWYHANKDRARANNRASRRRHPDRRAAQNAVYFAVKRDELIREPCEVCGTEPTEAHHDDYAKPLEVRWLCAQHHVEADVERRRRAA